YFEGPRAAPCRRPVPPGECRVSRRGQAGLRVDQGVLRAAVVTPRRELLKDGLHVGIILFLEDGEDRPAVLAPQTPTLPPAPEDQPVSPLGPRQVVVEGVPIAGCPVPAEVAAEALVEGGGELVRSAGLRHVHD